MGRLKMKVQIIPLVAIFIARRSKLTKRLKGRKYDTRLLYPAKSSSKYKGSRQNSIECKIAAYIFHMRLS